MAIYRNARTCFYNGLVSLPDTEAITSKDPQSPGALYELERVEYIDGSKIDHSTNGPGKDLADAIVRVVGHATEHSQSTGMGMATILQSSIFRPAPSGYVGERQQLAPGAPAQPQTVGDLLRAQEERPAEQGSVQAADGPDNERRLSVAAVNGSGRSTMGRRW